MCGRTRCSLPPDSIPTVTGIPKQRWKDRDNYKPKHNAGPGTWLPVLKTGDDGQTELHTMKWGLIPGYTKTGEHLDHFKMFNARSETLAESPVFRRLLPAQRCVVVLNGFYEWHQETESRKQPYYVSLGEEQVMKFAGLFDCWHDTSTDDNLYTCTIITTHASSRIKWLHGRMPVLLETSSREDVWLDGKNTKFPENFFEPCSSPELVWHPVTPAIGKLSFQSPECHKDIRKKGISRFFLQAKKEEVTIAKVSEDVDHDNKRNQNPSGVKLEDGKEPKPISVKRKISTPRQPSISPAKKRSRQQDIKQFFSSG